MRWTVEGGNDLGITSGQQTEQTDIEMAGNGLLGGRVRGRYGPRMATRVKLTLGPEEQMDGLVFSISCPESYLIATGTCWVRAQQRR